jgi:amino acid transporter
VSPPSPSIRAEREQKSKKELWKVTEKSNAGALIMIVVFTVLACVGFFVLFGISLIYVFALTLNIELALVLDFLISAVTVFTLIAIIAILRPPRRSPMVLSRRQRIGTCVAGAIIFVSSLPLIKIAPLLFPSCLLAPVAVIFILIYDALRSRKGKEMSKNEKGRCAANRGLWDYTAVACIVNELKAASGQSGNIHLGRRTFC